MPTVSLKSKIEKKGKPYEVLLPQIRASFSTLKESLPKHLDRIKEKVLDETRKYIDDNRKRGRGEYQDAWRLTKRNNLINVLIACSRVVSEDNNKTHRLSIGEFRFLDAHAKYWYIINYGGKVPSGDRPIPGYFGKGKPPMGDTYGDVFHKVNRIKGSNPYTRGGRGNVVGKGNSFFMIPKKPIPPMHYLEFMQQIFKQKITDLRVSFNK